MPVLPSQDGSGETGLRVREMLDRAVEYISKSGITLSGWILSIVVILGRIAIAPF